MSSGIVLLKGHTLPQANKSIKLDDMNMSVYNGDDNSDYCYMYSSTGSMIKNHNSIDYTNKIDVISTNKYLRENIGLPDGVYIDDMFPPSAPIQYVNMEYNNKHHNLQINGEISTSNN